MEAEWAGAAFDAGRDSAGRQAREKDVDGDWGLRRDVETEAGGALGSIWREGVVYVTEWYRKKGV